MAVIANAIYSITVMGSSIESAEIREMADIVLNIYDVPAEQLESCHVTSTSPQRRKSRAVRRLTACQPSAAMAEK